MKGKGCVVRGAGCEVRGAWCVVRGAGLRGAGCGLRGEGLGISTISAFLAQPFRVRRAHCKAVELHSTNTLVSCIKSYSQNHEY